MPFSATQIDLEIIILSKREKDKYHMISLICGTKKKDTNELIDKTEIDPQTQKTNLWVPKEKGGGWDKLGVWD